MRIFLDTNVLASAFATRGLCEDVLYETLSSHELIVADPLIEKLERVLVQKFKVPDTIVKETLSFLREGTIVARVSERITIPIKDKDDVLILSCALKGNADLFVTGDRELLELGQVDDMQIVSPREFWHRIKGG